MNIPYSYQTFQPIKKPDWFWFVLALLAIALFGVLRVCCGEEISYSNEAIADAIYRAENSVKYPYGIKSIPTYGNKEYARKICLNSIRNARKRWIKAGQPEDFISFMGRRYSPPAINPNWVRLVNHFLKLPNGA